MRTFLFGLALAVVLGAFIAPAAIGLSALAGVADSPAIRAWFFTVPEILCGIAGEDHPRGAMLVGASVVQHIPVGWLLAGAWQFVTRPDPVADVAAFDEAVTAFHADEA